MRGLVALAALTVLLPAAAYGRAAAGPTNTVLPTISGMVQEGGTAFADPGQWTGAGTITFAYTWEQCDNVGANCHLLPYQTQEAANLRIGNRGTLRVVVTATDSTGSATATSAPVAIRPGGGGSGGGGGGGGARSPNVTLKIVAPKKGAVIVGRSVRLIVKATGGPARVFVAPGGAFEGTRLQKGPNGAWAGVAKFDPREVGRVTWSVQAVSASGGPAAKATSYVRRYLRRYVTGRGLAAMEYASVLGCNPCRLRDAAGDATGGGADITEVYAAARGGSVTVKITTPNGWARSGAVCFLFGVPKHSNTPGHGGGTVGCFGPKVNNGGLDADVPVRVTHPNAATTVIVMPLAPLRHSVYELGNQHYLLLAIWSSGHGDATFDVYPGKRLDPYEPKFKLQLVPDA